MPAIRPHQALVANDNDSDLESTSSNTSSSLSKLDSSDFSQDDKEYFSYDESLDESLDEDSNSKHQSPPPTSGESASTLAAREHPISACAQAVTLKALSYTGNQIEKMTGISRSQIQRI
jgi:hypothetical protein